MAGYLFTFSDKESLFEAMRKGAYTTRMRIKWGGPAIGTLGDYVTMQPGDSVYFFSDRMVYGIGRIVQVVPGVTVLENFEGATGASFDSSDPLPSDVLLSVLDDDRLGRWVITFEPDPYMFAKGIDMDDLLSSNPTAFRSLRVFWKKSFMKLDDEEEMAFRAAILRRNIDTLKEPKEDELMDVKYLEEHARIRRAVQGRSPALKVREYISGCRKVNGSISSEMALEVALLAQLSEGEKSATEAFGCWDYLSHQVHASPAKAVDYMDKIDVFGYRWIDGYEPIVEKYLVAELKRDVVTGNDLQQVMKYVDWVKSEYANGDYSLIKAFLVGHSFDSESINAALPTTERYSLLGYRPPEPYRWCDVTLVSYEVGSEGVVRFSVEG